MVLRRWVSSRCWCGRRFSLPRSNKSTSPCGSIPADLAPLRKMTVAVIAAVAEFERDLLIERTQAGLVRAKAQGKTLGRLSSLTPSQQDAVRLRRRSGASLRRWRRNLASAVLRFSAPRIDHDGAAGRLSSCQQACAVRLLPSQLCACNNNGRPRILPLRRQPRGARHNGQQRRQRPCL